MTTLQNTAATPSLKSSLDFSFMRKAGVECADLVVLSHLRWDFVFQRPQHLLTRFADHCRVFFFEEPVFDAEQPHLEIKLRENGVQVVVPHLPTGLPEESVNAQQRSLIDQLMTDQGISDFALWYYTPMALPFTRHLEPRSVVYDCMDELSHFKGAHPELVKNETELFRRADVVFTGGHNLYEFKREKHPNIHPFPSSIDRAHFGQAKSSDVTEPLDQQAIAGPRIGFFGVIDERMDISLIEGLARARPEWNLVILGPVVKIDPNSLPQLPNIHYLGGKQYAELPAYLAGWDLAILPFAKNESTRFISPTKTPEYLAAGKPVVSTSIRDVVRPYGEEGLVLIADTVPDFVKACELGIEMGKTDLAWQLRVEEFLSTISWDQTWQEMTNHLNQVILKEKATPARIQLAS